MNMGNAQKNDQQITSQTPKAVILTALPVEYLSGIQNLDTKTGKNKV